MPIRHTVLRQLLGQETLVLKYSPQKEDLVPNATDATTGEEIPTILTQEHLRSLDSELAAYPLHRWSAWEALTSCVSDEDIVRLVGPKRKLDSLFESPADDEVEPKKYGEQSGTAKITDRAGSQVSSTDGHLMYAPFDLRRSWRKGAVGEEVTLYSKDKSWLLQHVIKEQFGGGEFHLALQTARADHQADYVRLLAQVQLAFIIFVNVQNFSSLLAFKRFLALLARSERIFSQEGLFTEGGLMLATIQELYVKLLRTLTIQLESLPDTFFTVDLAGTGLQDFLREELEALFRSIMRGHSGTGAVPSDLNEPMMRLRNVARERYQWEFEDGSSKTSEDDESLEEGEDAPVIVEL